MEVRVFTDLLLNLRQAVLQATKRFIIFLIDCVLQSLLVDRHLLDHVRFGFSRRHEPHPKLDWNSLSHCTP